MGSLQNATAVLEPAISNETPACLCPWRENPYRLMNLWDMLRIYAANFMRVSARLEFVTTNPGVLSAPDHLADDTVVDKFAEALESIERDCGNFGLVHTLEIALYHKGRFLQCAMTYAEAQRSANEIFRIYQSELRNALFLYVARDRADYYGQPQLFGGVVQIAFPSCGQDISEAGNCYALERDTGCVMYLMRVLEVALSVMAAEFGVSAVRENWQNIIEKIESKVSGLGPTDGPGWKERKEFYAAACTQFMHFKNAWRNHAMHSRTRYNGEEAKRIFEHVKEFLQVLAVRLHE